MAPLTIEHHRNSAGDVPAEARAAPSRLVRPAGAIIAAALAGGGSVLAAASDPSLSRAGLATLGVFVFTAVLWVTSAFPPFAVGLLAVALLAIGLGTTALGVSGESGTVLLPWTRLAGEFASTPVVMTLAGMLLATGAARTGVDRAVAARLLGPILGRPRRLLIMIAALGATLSMVMSNTATTVLLLTLIAPLVGPLGAGSRSARAMVLATACGAAVGGLATPIGTTPNVIAFGLLREARLPVSFAWWMLLGVPVVAGVLGVIIWRLQQLAGGFADWRPPPASISRQAVSGLGWAWCAIFVVTISLWISQPWTGIPIAVSSLIPLAALPMLGIVDAGAIREVDWSTVLLLAAGLCLGVAMSDSGLAAWIIARTVPDAAPRAVMVLVFCVISVSLSTFMSNTATTNLLIPMTLFEGDKEKAKEHFEAGFRKAFTALRDKMDARFPLTVYYAFKQDDEAESGDEDGEGGSGVDLTTGWETLLEALVSSGFQITGTWPVRASQAWRMRAMGSNALASYIVLACRPRGQDAPLATRKEFMSALRQELPGALRKLQMGNIAPVDLAQASIGPGMSIFSRYSKVIESDGRSMTVRTALGIVNQVLDEVLTAQEGDFDPDTRWALAWFEQFGMNEELFGTAETLSKAKNTSVKGLEDAGIVKSRGGKVRLVRREELPEGWDPTTDTRLRQWETVQHLIRTLETKGEAEAAKLLNRLGGMGETARELAYRLFAICERNKWSEEAMSYNSVVIAWPELSRLALSTRGKPPDSQGDLF